jgi:hypothetical protein
MLDYVVTSNHIHLLVKDTGEDENIRIVTPRVFRDLL